MKVYFDNSATTPLNPEVFKAMEPYFSKIYGNPSSLHDFGAASAKAINLARETTAKCINAETEEIIFTGSGTEADNLAVFGTVNLYAGKDRQTPHIIISSVEHHAVFHAAKHLERQGIEVTYAGVDKTGKVNAKDVISAVKENTVLISIMHANNEVGTVQPIGEIAAALKEVNAKRKKPVYFHTDAVQTAGKIAVDVKKLGVDMLSMAGHKFYGPKGVGVLYIKKGVFISPVIFGGAQERSLRPGTENTPGIVGFAKALSIATENLEKNHAHTRALRTKLRDAILKNIPETQINGDFDYSVGGILNVSFKYIEGEALLLKLNMAGIAASTGSACATGSAEPSHVLSAIGTDILCAQGAVRFSIGAQNTEEEIDYLISILPKIVQELREMSPVWKKQ
jgi:cysteine desulfurase